MNRYPGRLRGLFGKGRRYDAADLAADRAQDRAQTAAYYHEEGCPHGAQPSRCRACERKADAPRERWRTVPCPVCSRTVWVDRGRQAHPHGSAPPERLPLCDGSYRLIVTTIDDVPF